MKSLYKLNPDDHSVIETAFNIAKDELTPTVPIESTVFSNAEEFKIVNRSVGNSLIGRASRLMIETPLISERNNESILYVSPSSSYMDFAIVLIDYRKKNPLIVACVTASVEGYSYNSARFENDTWSSGISNDFTTESVYELINKVSLNLNQDVIYFTGKY